MKLGSLFDGAGTCPLAASAVGIKPVWASEIEPFPVSVTQARFPSMLHIGNILEINGAEIEPVEVITFGSPCQNLSIAGNRKGLAGEESCLFMEAVRVITEMREATDGRCPEICIWENVPGAFSSNKGEDFRTVLEKLCQIKDRGTSIPRSTDRGGSQRWSDAGLILGDGYSLAWRCLDAQFWGVPQRRKRVFAVLDLGGECAGKILFERGGLSRDFKKVRSARQETPRTDENSTAQHDLSYAVENHPQDSRVKLSEGNIVQTLSKQMGTGGGNVPLVMEPMPHAFSQKAYDQFSEDESGATLKATGGSYGGGNGDIDCPAALDLYNQQLTGGVTMTLTCSRSDARHVPCVIEPHVICRATQQGNAETLVDLAPTVTASAGMSGNNQPVAAIPYTLKIRGGREGGGVKAY